MHFVRMIDPASVINCLVIVRALDDVFFRGRSILV
jgi:hypothetical protein